MKNRVEKNCVVIMYGGAINDPPTWQAARELSLKGYKITIIQLDGVNNDASKPLDWVEIVSVFPTRWSKNIHKLQRFVLWIKFIRTVRKAINLYRPDLVVTIMLHGLASLPRPSKAKKYQLISCIYDIPSIKDAGYLDRWIISIGWGRLRNADIVWSSDPYKKSLAASFGHLSRQPIVCYNCPTISYISEPMSQRKEWLWQELRQGDERGKQGNILLRAGAIGVNCGLEETLKAMISLPDNFIFLMMGRPTSSYKRQIQEKIKSLGLVKRAFLWDRPSDKLWRNALQGADIGHLIHAPDSSGPQKRTYDLNSSLSNNRLFQYMAAGLPIIWYDDDRLATMHNHIPCFRMARLSHLQEDIAKIWLELGNDSFLRTKLGNSGRKAHLEEYNWEEQFSDVTNKLQELK